MDRTYVKPDAELLQSVLCHLICDSLVTGLDDFEDLTDYEW